MSEIVFTKFHLKKSGGLEKYSLKIIDKYLEMGFLVTLLTTEVSYSVENKKNLKIIILKIPKILSLFKLLLFNMKCKKWLKKNNSKVIFSFDRTTFYTHTRLGNGLHLSYLKRKKNFENVFYYFLNKFNPKNLFILYLERKGLKQKDLKKIIVNSKMVQNELLSTFNINPKNIQVVHNGVEFEEVENDFNAWKNEKNKNIEKLNLNNKDYHFLFVGNDYKRKGLIPLLKALSKIHDKPFHLSILGKENNIEKFKNLVKELNLENNVTFFGKREDIINFYQIADCLIIPSFYDPFSNVAIEALSMGVFVITSQFNGAKEILNDKTGVVVDILDIYSFTKALEDTMKIKKNIPRAKIIRKSVKNLDFSNQLEKLTKAINI